MTTSTAERVPATPAARRRAAQLNVVVAEVITAGRGVRVRDVEAHAALEATTARESDQPVWQTRALEVDVSGVDDLLATVERAAGEASDTHPITDRSGGTGEVAVTDVGRHGAVFGTALGVRDRCCVLGVGAVVRRPVVVRIADDQEAIGIRPMAHLVLTYDHRLIDDDEAGSYLVAVHQRLGLQNGTRA